jgi:cytochrome c556
MPTPTLTLLAFAAIAALFSVAALADDAAPITVDPAIASMTSDQKVEARQKAMKEDGSVLRGAMKATGADAAEIATKVLQNFTNFPALFADGATNDKSEALPIIWQEFDKFTTIIDEGKLAATKMREAALGGDQGLYLDSFKALAATCSECHQTYRGH